MKQNMGFIDRLVRILFAATVAILFGVGAINGVAAIVLGSFAVIMTATSFMGFCPLYLPFGLSTKKKTVKGTLLTLTAAGRA